MMASYHAQRTKRQPAKGRRCCKPSPSTTPGPITTQPQHQKPHLPHPAANLAHPHTPAHIQSTAASRCTSSPPTHPAPPPGGSWSHHTSRSSWEKWVDWSAWLCKKNGYEYDTGRISCQADGSNPHGIRARSPLGNLALFSWGFAASCGSNPGRDSTSRAETATRLRGQPRKQRHGDIHGPCPGATDKGSWDAVLGHQSTEVLAMLVGQRQRVAFWRVHMMSLHHISFTQFRHREGEA